MGSAQYGHGVRLTPLPLRVVVVFFVVCFIQVQGFECKVRKQPLDAKS